MPRYGTIVVIKRNGTDGIVFPLTSTSCLFGRKTECDIRMRLPWVSNEHCKIEINENKEAVLTNLSSVNPTQLNGACFEQPVPLKHGDVLTIIDRSFRFEYPLLSTPKKRHSRSPKDETLQVLHVQQVAEVELQHKQTPGAKNVDASDNAECEEKNADENKETPEENLPEAFPVKLQTPKSSQRINRVLKKQNEMSPFSKLYESVKNELKVEKPLHRRIASQQAAKGDPDSVLPEPCAPISSLSCLFDLGSLDKGKETGRMENIEKCIIVRREEENSPGFNQLSAGGRTPRRSFTRSPRAPISREVSGDTSQSPLQDPKELGTLGRSRGAAVTPTPSKKNPRSSLVLLEQCSIERFECPIQGTVCSPSSCRVPKVGTPTPRRKSPRSLFVSPPKETTGMNPGNPDTPRTPRHGLLKLKLLPEIPVGAPGEDPECRIDNTQLLLPEDKCLKQRRSSKQQTPGKPVQEVLKEIWDQANLDNSKGGHCETPASLSNSKSPKRNSRESKEFLDKSAHSEALATEGVLASPAGQTPGRKRGRPRSSGVLDEATLETNTAQEQHELGRKASGTPAELATDRCPQNQDLEDASATRPRRSSAKRRSESAAELRDTEPASETTTFGLLNGEDSGKTKRTSQKRKSGEMLPQTLGKRKRVSFGGHLSPELFDKSLPPNSPLKRGALPARRSLPYGNSPRAVLKKAQGLKHLINQEEKWSPKNSPTQQPPGASSPVSTPKIPSGSPGPFRKGRFSISQPPTPFPIAEEKNAGTEDMDPEGKSDVQMKTPKSAPAAQDAKALVTRTAAKSARGAQLALKGSAMKSRGGAVAVISAKRRSGASSANLLVAKSWAEVVKLGVARPQTKTAKKSVRKGRALKRINHPPKTPEKKIKGHFSTGHAESPATIVVGRAYSTTVGSAGHIPKVVKNPKLKLNMDMDESFTGVPEMFQTPEDHGGRTFPLAAAQNADVTPPWAAGDISDLHTPEESGEMVVSPLNNSDASEQKQASPGIFHLLREESSPSMFDEIATKTPENRKAVHKDTVDSLVIIPEKTVSLVKSGSKKRTPKHKLEPVEVMSSKRKILRTPEQRSEPGEVLSGIKRLVKTSRQNPEPTEVLSGIKRLVKTPDQQLEPVEVLSRIKELRRTPKQKLEPVEFLSGIKQLMRTPEQELEPVEVLSSKRKILRTPEQRSEPGEVLSGIKRLVKTSRQNPEPTEVLSGIKRLVNTPDQQLEPVEVLSRIKELRRTPKQKLEPVEFLSGIKQLMRTPEQELEPEEVLSSKRKILRTPEERSEPGEVLSGIKRLVKTSRQNPEPTEVLSGIKRLVKTSRQKPEPTEVLSGIKRLVKTPNQKLEPVEVLSGIKELLKTPNQKLEPAEVLSGIKQLMKTPNQKLEPAEVLSGIKQLMKTPNQKLEPVEVLSGIKELLKTPNQKLEPAEVLSGIKQLMKTPAQKLEPAEVLSGIKQLMKTPAQKLEPVEVLSSKRKILRTPEQRSEPGEVLSGIKRLVKTSRQKPEPTEFLSGIKRLVKTPNQKLEPVEVLSGIKQLMKTPNQKLEPAEVLSGIKQLLKTPDQKLEPVEVFSGIKQLMRTPRRKPGSVEDLSGIKQLLRTPQQELEPLTDEIALKRLLDTPVESREAVKAVPGVTSTKKTPKLKPQPMEDTVLIRRVYQAPKEKVEPVENMFGISRLMKSPKEKYQPVEDFVGLQRLMAEPRQKSSDSEVDYAGMTEMFGTPEEMKVRSVNVMDSQGEIGSNSSHKHEKRGKFSQGEDSQQKDSTGEEQPTQRLRSGRPRRALPPVAAKPSENGVSLKLQSPDTQEEMGVITPENKGRGRRTKHCTQEAVPKCPDQEGLDVVSFVEPPGAAQRPGRGKRKELKESKHPNENLESCVEDSSVLRKAPANTKQSLQDCGINETEDDPGIKTGSGNIQSEICQQQTDLNDPDSKAIDSGIEDSEEEVLLSLRRRRRGVENTEPVIPPKRRRARDDQGKAASPGGLYGTTRKLRKDPSPKVSQRQEQACDKAPEAVTAQESENGTKLELKATELRVKSFRSTRNRKHSAEIKADTRGVALENPQNIQKTEETSTETDAETESHVKNGIKGSQGSEIENAQENTTQAARRLKAESPSAETNKMPVSAQNLEANRARNRRGKKDSLEQKANEFTENVNSLKPITPKFKSETEVDESSLQDSMGSVCVSAAQGRKEQPSPGATSVPAADSARPTRGTQRRTRNEQGILKAKQTEILQGNPAQRNAVMCRRGTGRKVNFQLEEGSSKAVEGKSLPEGDEGVTDKDNQHENSENAPSQGRRSRRKQLDFIPQKASPAFMEKQALSADHRKDEAVVQEPGSALEAAPSSAEDNPPRRGRRREVAATSQTRSPSVRTRRGLLQGDAKKLAEREEENPALANKTLQAKVDASARDRRNKMGPAAEARSSAPLQRKCGLSETKDKGTDEEQNVPLEAVSCAKEKPPGRGRRKETALASHTTNSISLRGKRRLPAGDGEEAPKEQQNVALETCDPSGKENQLRRGRRKEIAPLIEAKSSIQGNQVLSKQSGRKNNNKEAKQNLDNSSQENMELVKRSSRQATTSLALSPTSLQGLPEDGKDRIAKEQSRLLDLAPPAKENPSRTGRKKTASSSSEETSSTSLRGNPNLPRGRGQKRILKGSEDASPENNPCQGRTRQLRNNRRKVEVPLEAATSAPHKSSGLAEDGNTLGTQGLSGASTGSEENQSGKGQESDPAPQAAPTSRRRKCQLPAEDMAPKKLKSGNDENGSLQRGRRNKTKLGEEDARAAQTTGGMEKRTRSSIRTRK